MFIKTLEIESALAAIEAKRNVFIAGRAGTGKSTMLNNFVVPKLQEIGAQYVALAPTGVAANNIRGQTIHSFFRLPLAAVTESDIIAAIYNPSNSKKHAVMRRLDVLILDEVSMIRSDIMHAIDQILRGVRKRKAEPFGGVQVLMFGDPYQLPPVVKESAVSMHLSQRFGNGSGARGPELFFCAPVCGAPFERVELTVVMRQKDVEFADMLNALRDGTWSDETLSALNARALVQPGEKSVHLTATRYAASQINEAMIENLLRERGDAKLITLAASVNNMRENESPVDFNIGICAGARVMLMKNNPGQGYYNGSLGTFLGTSTEAATDEEPEHMSLNIRLDTGREVSLVRETWEKLDYVIAGNSLERRVVGSVEQFPIRLAWAMTIHKAQGLTLSEVHVDLGAGAFECGQTYVALSRVTSMDGLTLARPITPADLMVHPEAHWYKQRFQCVRADQPSLDVAAQPTL